MKALLNLLLAIILAIIMCGGCTVPAYLLASISFPAEGTRIASKRLVVQWQARYRPRQFVSWQTGVRSATPDFTLSLDGDLVVAGPDQAFDGVVLAPLTPGRHVLRLEAHVGRHRVAHEVPFDIVDAPSPWRLETVPYEGEGLYVFDALGRAIPLPAEEGVRLAFADGRGVFEMRRPPGAQEERLTFRPWIWEQLGAPQDLPLPADGQGNLVGPGFWLADRLYAWKGDAWQPLPALPKALPKAVADYFGNTDAIFQEHANFFWARACGSEVWVSLTWRASVAQGPEHWAYLARLRQGQWEAVPPPTPNGFFVPYCFDDQVWLVNVASNGSSLVAGQFVQWGWFLNRGSPWSFAESQGRGRTYRWQSGRWEEAIAPPLVLPIESVYQFEWMPSFYGPVFAWLHNQQYVFMVPVELPHR